MKNNGDNGEVLRSFHLKIRNKRDAVKLDRFQQLAIFEGEAPAATLMSMIDSFNKFGAQRVLASEAQMVDALHKAKLSTGTRQVLKTLRDSGQLVGPEGEKLWGTDGNSIVYDLRGVIGFFRRRRSLTTKSRRGAALN